MDATTSQFEQLMRAFMVESTALHLNIPDALWTGQRQCHP